MDGHFPTTGHRDGLLCNAPVCYMARCQVYSGAELAARADNCRKPLPLRKRSDPPLAFPIVAGKVLRSDDAGCTWRAAATIRSLAITASKLRPSSQRRAETGEAAAKALEIAYARHHRPPFVRATP